MSTVVLPASSAPAREHAAQVLAHGEGLLANYPVARTLRRLAARDLHSMSERWEDEANEHYIAGRLKRAAHIDWMRATVLG